MSIEFFVFETAELVADVREFVAFRALYDVVQDQHSTVIARLEDEHILVLALFMMEDLIDF